MEPKRIDFPEIDKDFEAAIVESIEDMHFTVSLRIAEYRINFLKVKIDYLKSFKYQAIRRGSEHHANLLLYMQCVTQAVCSVFIAFKWIRENENMKAWCGVIDAYEYLDIALRALRAVDGNLSAETLSGIEAIRRLIIKFEEGVFPSHKVYNSPGFVETVGDCSICDQGFLECEHVEGDVYSGLYCVRKNRKPLDFEHFAVVENPRDRRCIFTTKHNAAGESVDIFSREPTKEPKEENVYEGVLFYMGELDVN
jgi:hypothetical protein